MVRFFLVAGLFLEILLFFFLRASTQLFILTLKPHSPTDFANLAVVWFWLLGVIFTAGGGTIIVFLAANWYRRKYKGKEPLWKMVLLSWFSFFAFLAITATAFLIATLIKSPQPLRPTPRPILIR